MSISQKKRDKLYAAIHSEIIDLRMELKLPSEQDFKIAQVEIKIWRKQKIALGLEESQ